MTPTLTQKLSDRANDRREVATKNYRECLEVAARADKPPAKLIDDLETAAERLGFDPEQVAADISLIHRRETLITQIEANEPDQRELREKLRSLEKELSTSARIKRKQAFLAAENELRTKYRSVQSLIATHRRAVNERATTEGRISQMGDCTND
jgi:hypothetical protein